MDNHQLNSIESIAQTVPSWDLERWSKECSALSPEQLALLVPYASQDFDHQNWKEKLHHLFIHLPNSPVENFGNALSYVQLLEIMRFCEMHQDPANRKKLSSLFVGISPIVFKDLLTHSSQTELSFLKEEAVTEAIQHHLSILTHELTLRFDEFCNQISIKEREIENVDLKMIGCKDVENFYLQFEQFHKEGKKILNLTSRAIAIAWNANRVDLIQELGRIKELCQKCLNESIGNMETEETPSLGLYQLLNKKVEVLFSDQDSKGDLALMKDSTPALEALVKFSVWYIQDYIDVGLLPKFNGKHSDLDNDEEFHHRDQLFTAAENNLAKMGLKTLLDLKNAKIFSKKALKEYILAFQNNSR